MNKTRRVLPVAAVALAACAGNPRPILLDDAANQHVWPLPPEPARISYVGQVASERDLGKESSFFERLKDGLLGTEEQGLLTKRPFDTTVDGLGRVYVSNGALGALLVLDPQNHDATVLRPEGSAQLAKPLGLDTDQQGHIYVADPVLRRVVAIDEEGAFVAAYGGRGVLLNPVDVAISPDGDRIYVADSYLHQLVIFDRDGTLIRRVGKNEGPLDKDIDTRTMTHGAGEDPSPAVAGHGDPGDVTENRGTLQGEFRYPSFLDVGGDGNVWVSDAVNFRVQGFDAEGNFLRQIGQHGDAPGALARPKGVAVDTEGHVYIVDAAFNNVQIFDPEGQLLLAFGGVGTGPGTLWMPLGLSIGADDRIYIADRFNDRVQVYQYHSVPELKAPEPEEAKPDEGASDAGIPPVDPTRTGG